MPDRPCQDESREIEDLQAVLEQERDTLATIMEHAGEVLLAYLDRDFRFVHVNTAYVDKSGHTREGLLGSHHFDLFPNEENEGIFRRARDTGETVSFKAKPFVYEDQPWRGVTYWDWTLTPVKAEDGEVTGLVFSLVDVTAPIRRHQLSQAFAELDALVHSSLEVETILRMLPSKAAEAAGSEAAGIGLRSAEGWRMPYVSEGFVKVYAHEPLLPEQMPAAELAATTRQTVVIDDVAADTRVASVLEPLGIKSMLNVPLFIRGEVVGVLGLHYTSEAVPFGEPVIEFAERLAASTSLALTNAQLYEEEHRVAEALRDALLRPPPGLPGLEIGFVYRAAYEAERVGGDFYDVFELDGGRVGVLVGDVSGKGLKAAGLTETVRSSVRALAHVDPSPGAVLTRLDRTLMPQLDSSTFVTAVFGVMDAASGEVCLASAGHPEPLLCHGGKATFIDLPLGVVLGQFGAEYRETCVPLGGGTLLLYTDGVTDVRRDGRLFGQGRLRRALGRCEVGEPQALVDKVLAAILEHGRGKLPDDVAMVAVRRISG